MHVHRLIPMWRKSFEEAVGVTDPHTIEDQTNYFLTTVLPDNAVRIVLRGADVVAFVAASTESIAQLYVHVDYQGIGIGSKLLQWAKDRSDGRLSLYTFDRNERAKRFYENRGFKIVARGFEETWQLADIRYEWTRDSKTALSG